MGNFKSIAELDFQNLIKSEYFPSPDAWEDQVLYFLLLDRFSDGQEKGFIDNDGNVVTAGNTVKYLPTDFENAIQTTQDAEIWNEAGQKFVGGSLIGLKSKIGYLKRLGISAIWISPVFKQVVSQETYHGYGIQDFLDIEPRFGSTQDLVDVVKTAHDHGIYVILDIILNHSGDVFGYINGQPDYQSGKTFSVEGFRNALGIPDLPLDFVGDNKYPDAAIWPKELQTAETFTQKGKIIHWDDSPEFLEGDFEVLKDLHHGSGLVDNYSPSETLKALTKAYKYWIAIADIDGFRIDTVKHMDPGATRYFASVIKEFTMSIKKENFYLIGEITGGRQRAFDTLEITGLDAALGIDDIPDKMEYMVKGYRNPTDYFNLFRNSELVHKESHIWFRNKVVTLFDDHDQVRKGNNKARFCANDSGVLSLIAVVGLNLTSLGIPCLYYGTEQGFDGKGGNDRYIRESMFGRNFGAFRSRDVHFFNEENQWFSEIAKIVKIRKEHLALRRGRQYLRQISGNGTEFGYPALMGDRMNSIVAWSRICDDKEILCAFNTDQQNETIAYVTIDESLHEIDSHLKCLYASGVSPVQVNVETRNGKAVRLTIPPAGFVIYG
ncbi:alpha-amylase family glycosyl hydrolase [Dyadobacter frigoris]|uniref:Alpha-amylase n=1 Tax=Dyadobacter frigoris TaxID=2576211 RepID=A0A4V6BJ14_9BACT|nr:alpha-amylase family glycosyl hydrolase [Dyadobacter frigoris]TKT91853.1 alpha-amylase [Dyadobacter frigoris]GLU53284.1 alpha-amylase [Dyadobacter frigoris]